jgi:integrase
MGTLLKVQVVRHVDGQGRRVAKGTPGARVIKERSSKWYGQFVGEDGRRRRVPLCADKGAALQMLADLERRVARGKVGLVDPYEKHRGAPIDEHVEAYEAHLRNNEGVSAKHLKETMRRLRFVLRGCQAAKLSDMRNDSVERVLRQLAEGGATGTFPGGASARTRNLYLSSIRAFARWCHDSGRLEGDPLAPAPAAQRRKRKGRAHHLASSGDIRRKRRALTEDELLRLLRAARERPLREAMTVRTGSRRGEVVGRVREEVKERLERLGWERSLIYKTLVLTGLRRGELAALRAHDLSLDIAQPVLKLPGEATKNGEEARILLRRDLADELIEWLEATCRKGHDRVFQVPVELVKILKRDLTAAAIPFRDERGRTLDVHSLRYTTATFLSRAKVPPRVAQKILRHSDINLTMRVYTDVHPHDEAEAVEAMPALQRADSAAWKDSSVTSGPSDRKPTV